MSTAVKKEGQDSRLYSYTKIFGTPTRELNQSFELPALNVFDQNNTQACVSCAFASAMEIIFGIVASPGLIYATCRDECHKDPGLYLYRAADLLCKIGFIPFVEFGLIAEVPFILEIIKEHPEWIEMASKIKPLGYCNLNYADKALKEKCIKDAVSRADEGVAVAIVVDDHGVILVGWNEETKKFKYQDSYGKENCRKEIAPNKIDHAVAFFSKPLELPFKDVEEDAWYKKHLEHLYFSDIVNGVTADTIEPHRPIERCEVFALVDRVLSRLAENNASIWKVINEIIDKI